ncbi:hypothetical protein NZD89_27055 [Alicyclobacillus fastidiosus]|uniref:Big-1 domain-containing protein n=1 Tax=Alicyclobacillus fastidiosus TaxID=392011 RepID=A0ABY6ZI75_9BACL|nr:hypothetical protein [Alicyclobacillus fastidiosus]WAH41819.1 hypothetical protein NZD89_27055 [Alicyclobacillus fastidiosus]GMA63517.1 hypothetical protein GCM10025859_39570 [Alicyclobacillus fastidiosus]
MKRALTGIAAAAVVLGSVSPMAFAATTTSGLTKAGQLPIVVNGSVLSNPYEMTGKDSGNTTGFFPVYYFEQALAKIGYTATWDGTTHTFAITANGVTPAAVAGGVGTGNTTVTVNGTVVKKFNTQVAKDPAGGAKAQATTYMPVYYINNVLTALGVNGSFSGQTGLKIVGSTNGTGSIGPITIGGANSGTGAAASPAVSYGSDLTVSANLTDANGNPVAGVNTTLSVWGSQEPTVTVNGINANPTAITGGYSFQVATNAAGEAVATISVPSGVAASYTFQFAAPYTVNGTQVTDSKVYAEFVTANTAAISPYAADSSDAYQVPVSSLSNETTGLVPVTVTLPLLNGEPQANVNVNFSISSVHGDAFLANSAGTELTSPQTVATNSQGQATIWVNSNEADTATITATPSGQTGLTTYVGWGDSGVATQLNSTLGASGVTGGSGTVGSPYTASASSNVTVTATAEDVLGNPVPNATLLITSVGGKGKYVSGSTATDFPNATPASGSEVSSTGSPFGQIVTTNANGQFSFTANDSTIGDDDQYNVYVIQNSEVGNSGDSIGSIYVNYTGSTTSVANVGVAANGQLVTAYVNNSNAPTTSLSNVEYPSTVENSSDYVTNGLNNIEVGAFDGSAQDYLADNTSGTVTYQLSSGGSSFIDAVDGVYLDGENPGLPNKVTAVNATVTGYTPAGAQADTDYFQVSVNGTTIGYYSVNTSTGATSTTLSTTSGTGGASELPAGVTAEPTFTKGTFALPSDEGNVLTTGHRLVSGLNFSVGDESTETPTVTAAIGSVSATAKPQFIPGGAAKLAASPSLASPVNGTGENVTLTVEDANGNPVVDAPVSVVTGQAGATANTNLWITAVNGTSLSQTFGTNNTTEPTPIPLYAVTTPEATAYNSVVLPGVVSWGSTSGLTVYTDANGKVQLTLQNGGVNYYGTDGGSPATLSLQTSPSTSSYQATAVVSYPSSGTTTIDINGSAPTADAGDTVSTINWQ